MQQIFHADMGVFPLPAGAGEPLTSAIPLHPIHSDLTPTVHGAPHNLATVAIATSNDGGLHKARARKDQILTDSYIDQIKTKWGIYDVMDIFPENMIPMRNVPNDFPVFETDARNLPLPLLRALGDLSGKYPEEMVHAMEGVVNRMLARTQNSANAVNNIEAEDVELVLGVFKRQDEDEKLEAL
jgi:hypothetical protein